MGDPESEEALRAHSCVDGGESIDGMDAGEAVLANWEPLRRGEQRRGHRRTWSKLSRSPSTLESKLLDLEVIPHLKCDETRTACQALEVNAKDLRGGNTHLIAAMVGTSDASGEDTRPGVQHASVAHDQGALKTGERRLDFGAGVTSFLDDLS